MPALCRDALPADSGCQDLPPVVPIKFSFAKQFICGILNSLLEMGSGEPGRFAAGKPFLDKKTFNGYTMKVSYGPVV